MEAVQNAAETLAGFTAQLEIWRDEAVPGTPPAQSQVRFFVNDITPTSETLVGDFTEPTGAWYDPTDRPAQYGEPYLKDGEYWSSLAVPQTNFDPAGPVGPFIVYGAFSCDKAKTDWIHAVRFLSPVNLATTLDSIPAFTIEVRAPED